MYAKNITTFLLALMKEGQLNLDLEDEIVLGTLLSQAGEVVHPLVREIAGLGPLPTAGKGDAE
jgi:hypothetical protein